MRAQETLHFQYSNNSFVQNLSRDEVSGGKSHTPHNMDMFHFTHQGGENLTGVRFKTTSSCSNTQHSWLEIRLISWQLQLPTHPLTNSLIRTIFQTYFNSSAFVFPYKFPVKTKKQIWSSESRSSGVVHIVVWRCSETPTPALAWSPPPQWGQRVQRLVARLRISSVSVRGGPPPEPSGSKTPPGWSRSTSSSFPTEKHQEHHHNGNAFQGERGQTSGVVSLVGLPAQVETFPTSPGSCFQLAGPRPAPSRWTASPPAPWSSGKVRRERWRERLAADSRHEPFVSYLPDARHVGLHVGQNVAQTYRWAQSEHFLQPREEAPGERGERATGHQRWYSPTCQRGRMMGWREHSVINRPTPDEEGMSTF